MNIADELLSLNNFLQDFLESLGRDPDELFVNYVDGNDEEDSREVGWWLEGEPRWLGDPGEYLGSSVNDARESLLFFYGSAS